MYRNSSDGNLRTNTFGRSAAKELLRSSSSLNFATSPNLAASQNLHNRSRADWIAENYNYDPDDVRPPTNYHMSQGSVTMVNPDFSKSTIPKRNYIDNDRGGYIEKPTFLRQISDLETRIKNNRGPNTPWRIVPSVPQTVIPTPAGPMPVNPIGFGAPFGGSPFGYYNPNYLYNQIGVKDEENKLLRNQIFSQREAIGELEEQVDTMAREGTRFEDIIHKGNQDLQTVRERYTQPTAYGGGITGVDIITTADPRKSFRSFGDNSDPRKSNFKWGDAETDNVLHGLASQEQELLRILSNIPENSSMYKTKANKLQTLVRQRVELEKMLYNRADYDQYYKEKVIDDQK